MVQQTFAERLKTAMDARGLKQVDLVRMASEQGIKLGKSQLSQYLSGKTAPRRDTLAFLSTALGTNLELELSSQPVQAPKQEAPMRTFNKSSKLDHVSYDVRGPVLDEAMRMEEEGIHILKLNIGNPAPFGFRTPDEVVQDMALTSSSVRFSATSQIRSTICIVASRVLSFNVPRNILNSMVSEFSRFTHVYRPAW